MPLHIMAVYQPNGETWRIIQAQIKAYIKTAIALAHAAGGSVMLAGAGTPRNKRRTDSHQRT